MINAADSGESAEVEPLADSGLEREAELAASLASNSLKPDSDQLSALRFRPHAQCDPAQLAQPEGERSVPLLFDVVIRESDPATLERLLPTSKCQPDSKP